MAYNIVAEHPQSGQDINRHIPSRQQIQGTTDWIIPQPKNSDSEEEGFGEMSKEERLEKAEQLMQKEAEPLTIDVGEVVKVNKDTLVERTDDGFIIYDVV